MSTADTAREVLDAEARRTPLGTPTWNTPDGYAAENEMIQAAPALARAVLRVEALADELESAATGSLADPSAGTWTIDQANAEREMARRIRTTLNGDDHA